MLAVRPLSMGSVETSDGEQQRVGNPFSQPLHPLQPVTRLANLPSVKDVRFCWQTTGAFTRSLRGVARRHVTTTDFQTRSTKINVVESIDGSKILFTNQIKLDSVAKFFRSPTLHPLTARLSLHPTRACILTPACRPPDTVVHRSQPILPCERA